MTELETYRGTPALLDPVTDSWTAVVENVATFAGQIANTEFVPNALRGRDNGAKVAAAILTGRELGLPPMTSLASIHVINGKPGISAEMMRALVLQAGHQIVISESSSVRVVMKGRRDGDEEWTTVEWSEQDSRRAGILSGNHVKYPRQMFAARATTELCRLIFADVIHGLRSIEELEDMGEQSADLALAPEEPAKAPVARRQRQAKVQPVDAEQTERQAEPTQRRSPGLTRRGSASETAAGSDEGKPGAEDAPADATDSAAPAGTAPSTQQQLKTARGMFETLSYSTADRAALANKVAGRELKALKDLTSDEADELIATLEQVIADLRPQSGEEAVERNTSDASSPSTPASGSTPSTPQDDPAGADATAAGSGGSVDETAEPPLPDEDGAFPAEVVDDPAEAEPRITMDQRPLVMKLLGDVGVQDRAERLSVLSDLTGRDITSTNELSKSEASSVIDSLQRCDTRDDLEQIIQATVAHREGRDS
jgi:hypothetical protein